MIGKGRPDPVVYSEVRMAMLVAKNNIPFSFADDFNKTVGDMFSDSTIAKQYSCGRTKMTQIVKGNWLRETCHIRSFAFYTLYESKTFYSKSD